MFDSLMHLVSGKNSEGIYNRPLLQRIEWIFCLFWRHTHLPSGRGIPSGMWKKLPTAPWLISNHKEERRISLRWAKDGIHSGIFIIYLRGFSHTSCYPGITAICCSVWITDWFIIQIKVDEPYRGRACKWRKIFIQRLLGNKTKIECFQNFVQTELLRIVM